MSETAGMVAAKREALWMQAHDDLESVVAAIEREQKRLAAAALGVCEECDHGWIGQDEPHGPAPCPYCQPEKYERTPWGRFLSSRGSDDNE
jgi:predicted Zn-ribbon and HTH transcriptional regulator